jgi:hypothetical protein
MRGCDGGSFREERGDLSIIPSRRDPYGISSTAAESSGYSIVCIIDWYWDLDSHLIAEPEGSEVPYLLT